MTLIEVKSRAHENGVVNLSVPLGTAGANREVRVIVGPLDDVVSVEQWQRFVHETAGSISDHSFQRHPQGEFECREVLFSRSTL